jgi:hypothetical protein
MDRLPKSGRVFLLVAFVAAGGILASFPSPSPVAADEILGGKLEKKSVEAPDY